MVTNMSIFVGKIAPDFNTSVVLPNNQIKEDFNLKSFVSGRNCVLMFYPLNFTFVCPSEIISLNNKLLEFEKRNCVVMTISVDSHFSHLAWKNTPVSEGGISNVQFIMVSDLNRAISKSYNVLNEGGIAMRGTFIIDKNFILRHFSVNDLAIGRNIDENLRILDAIAYNEQYGDGCPAGWHKGKPSMKQTADGVKDFLSKNADLL